MTRFFKRSTIIPDNIEVNYQDNMVDVKGPKGNIKKNFDQCVIVNIKDKVINIDCSGDKEVNSKFVGTAFSVINNMITGVVEGFNKTLLLSGVGFRVELKGKVLNMKLGFSHDINYTIPDGIDVVVEKNTIIKISGIDKEKVGQISSEIKNFKPVEPYKAKGIKYEDQYVFRKVGKKAGAGK